MILKETRLINRQQPPDGYFGVIVASAHAKIAASRIFSEVVLQYIASLVFNFYYFLNRNIKRFQLY